MNDIAIDVKDVTIRFNLASEKIDNLKEYFVKLIKHELLFQEFLAVRDASFTIRMPYPSKRMARPTPWKTRRVLALSMQHRKALLKS